MAGATGVLGSALVPQLVARGHEVVGMTRSASKQDLVRGLGARPVVADALDPDAVAKAVASAGPEVIVPEADPLDPNDPPAAMRTVQAGYLYLERAVTTIEWGAGLALRYGGFYGPRTSLSLAPDAVMAVLVRKRRFPIVGDGGGVFSHVHVENAAAATVVAVERGQPGVYNVVDDDPAPVREWLPVLASALDAKPPRHVPRWLARLVAGEAATAMMTEARVASNAKAKRELGWKPGYASWRQGFAQGLG